MHHPLSAFRAVHAANSGFTWLSIYVWPILSCPQTSYLQWILSYDEASRCNPSHIFFCSPALVRSRSGETLRANGSYTASRKDTMCVRDAGPNVSGVGVGRQIEVRFQRQLKRRLRARLILETGLTTVHSRDGSKIHKKPFQCS
jgi:hypothetical protein